MSEWKPIPSLLNQYEASDAGEIRSVRRRSTRGRVIKPYINKRNGYAYIVASVNNTQKTYRVHRLVAEAFLGESNGAQVNHIDGNKQNNAVSNLEYCTQSENMRHAFRIGLEKPRGVKIINCGTHEVFNSYAEAARSVGGVKSSSVQRVCDGIRSHYRGNRFARLSDYENGTIPEYKGIRTRKTSEMLWR